MKLVVRQYQHFWLIGTVERVPINIIDFINIIEYKEIWKHASAKSLEKWDKIQI